MSKEEFKEQYTIRLYAHKYWNHDELPPVEYRALVAKYIHDHPEEFRGAVPQ